MQYRFTCGIKKIYAVRFVGKKNFITPFLKNYKDNSLNTKNMPHGYTNQTQLTPRGILKRYMGPGAMNRWQTERNLLPVISEYLPVPPLLKQKNTGEIVTKRMYGLHGLDMVENGQSSIVLTALGKLLKLVQEVPAQKLHGLITGNGPVLVHGDYGPQNLLLNAKTNEPVALVDWEWAHLGDAVEDVASVEWTFRMFYTKEASKIQLFYEAYGEIPPWEERHEAMMSICKRQLEFARLLGKRKIIQQSQNRLHITSRFLSL